MMRFALAVAVLAFGSAISTAARADFTVIQFEDGRCQIWQDSVATPWGVGWRKIAIGLPDWLTARDALDSARVENLCR